MVGDCFNLWRVRIPRSLLRHESGIRFLDRNLLLEKYIIENRTFGLILSLIIATAFWSAAKYPAASCRVVYFHSNPFFINQLALNPLESIKNQQLHYFHHNHLYQSALACH
jgi:hypothetical protein